MAGRAMTPYEARFLEGLIRLEEGRLGSTVRGVLHGAKHGFAQGIKNIPSGVALETGLVGTYRRAIKGMSAKAAYGGALHHAIKYGIPVGLGIDTAIGAVGGGIHGYRSHKEPTHTHPNRSG